jgi:hypothetical protein
MKYALTLEFDSAEELTAYLGGKPAASGGAPRNAAPKPKEEPAEDDSGGIEYETVSALVVRLSKEKGRDVAINFLKGFKNPANKKPATKGAEIAPADYPRAVEEAEALLAEEDMA